MKIPVSAPFLIGIDFDIHRGYPTVITAVVLDTAKGEVVNCVQRKVSPYDLIPYHYAQVEKLKEELAKEYPQAAFIQGR
jgi:hypothetical protein